MLYYVMSPDLSIRNRQVRLKIFSNKTDETIYKAVEGHR